MVALLVFMMATLTTKNCSTEEVNLAGTFSKIQLNIKKC